VTFLIEVTHTAELYSVDSSFKPERFTAEESDQAAQIFMRKAEYPAGVDLGKVDEDLATPGGQVSHTDRHAGRTVTARQIENACAKCKRDRLSNGVGWALTKQGFLCPDCTVAVCPDDFEVLEPAGVV